MTERNTAALRGGRISYFFRIFQNTLISILLHVY
ncbi:hypothetical protein [Vibrio phage vB_pir03]|nr:hypothetical protein [Vibrio phage vB_pir03]